MEEQKGGDLSLRLVSRCQCLEEVELFNKTIAMTVIKLLGEAVSYLLVDTK